MLVRLRALKLFIYLFICCIFTVPVVSDVWSLTNFEPLIVGLYLPLCRHPPWRPLRAPTLWHKWKGTCGTCRRLLLDGAGLFCANFCFKQNHWMPCQQAQCGPCYKAIDTREFPICLPKDEDGQITTNEADATHYLQVRNGDPFQCDVQKGAEHSSISRF